MHPAWWCDTSEFIYLFYSILYGSVPHALSLHILPPLSGLSSLSLWQSMSPTLWCQQHALLP